MNDSWDDYANEWDANPSVIEYSNKAFDSLCKFVNLQGLSVLDFGCGTGLLAEKVALEASNVVAIDTSEKMIEVLNNKNIGNLQALALDINEGSVEELPILSSGFDVIIASSVCAFVPDYEATLSKLKSLLKQGGLFIQWDWLNNQDEGIGFSIDALESAYLNLGLSVVSIDDVFAISSEKRAMPVVMGVARK